MRTSPPKHAEPGWDMHEHGPGLIVSNERQLAAGSRLEVQVVCHHPYGLGVYAPTAEQYGHVNITEIGTGQIRGPEDYPPIGQKAAAHVLSYSGSNEQLTLSLKPAM